MFSQKAIRCLVEMDNSSCKAAPLETGIKLKSKNVYNIGTIISWQARGQNVHASMLAAIKVRVRRYFCTGWAKFFRDTRALVMCLWYNPFVFAPDEGVR